MLVEYKTADGCARFKGGARDQHHTHGANLETARLQLEYLGVR